MNLISIETMIAPVQYHDNVDRKAMLQTLKVSLYL